MQKSKLISICLFFTLLIGCSSTTVEEVSVSMPSSQINQASEMSSETAENGFTKIEKESYNIDEIVFQGENPLTTTQLANIESILNALSEAKMIDEFSTPNEIVDEKMIIYLGFRCKYFDEVLLDSQLNALMSKEKIFEIIKMDFGMSEYPKQMEIWGEGEIKAPFSSQGNRAEIQSIDKQGQTAFVIVKMYPTPARDNLSEEQLPKTMRYTFHLVEDRAVLQSAQRVSL